MQEKLKIMKLGALHAIRPGNPSGVFYSHWLLAIHFCVIGVVDKVSVSKIGSKNLN